MLSQQKSINSSDDDDYELPSLAERIKASLISQNPKIPPHVSSDSDDEDFLKFSEIIRSTPCSQVKFNQKEISDKITEESKNLKGVAKISPPPLNIKLDFSLTSDSEDEEAEFLSFSQRLQSTPQIRVSAPQVLEVKNCMQNESDSDDELFANLAERLSILTPRIQNKENCDTGIGVNDSKMKEFRTPFPPEKKVPYKSVDSESDESFSNFVEALKTPMSVNRKVPLKAANSESDESFSSFIERIKTPLSVNRKIQHKMTESNSDDSFSYNSRKQAFRTPRSQIKKQEDAVALPKIADAKQHHSHLSVKDNLNPVKICKSETEKEFMTLFEPEGITSTFLEKRISYTHMLYEFYNRRVFNSQLPADMPLFYDGSLKSTAGITHCSRKNNIYTCSIKLSPSVLNSFDKLKETLLHEMCHAAVWILNNRGDVSHGPLWRIWASRCKLILPFIECPTRCHKYEISYSVWYECPKCPWKKGKCKKVRKYHGAKCRRCNSPIIVTYTKT